MFKKIAIAVIAIVISAVAAGYQQQRKESNLQALERAALQQEVQEGRAPMAWTCQAFSMELVVNDDGELICHGVARFGADFVAENVAAFHLMVECSSANGAARLDGTVAAGAPALAVRCINTRFEERWVASNR